MNGTEKLRYNRAKREQQSPTYGISTGDIQGYFQERFDMLVASLRKNDQRYADLENIKIKVAVSRMSDIFHPLFLIMPTDVLENHRLMEDEGIPSVFLNRGEEDEVAHLIPVFENFLKMYAFAKSDLQMFRNPKWLREMNVNRRTMEKVAHLTTAHVMNFGRSNDDESGSGKAFVLIMLDPMRVLHDMVVDENNPRAKFTVSVTEVKKYKNSVYEYKFKKHIGKKNKKDIDINQIMKELSAAIRS